VTFEEAMEAIRAGHVVRRARWGRKKQDCYLLDVEAMEATDWLIVEPSATEGPLVAEEATEDLSPWFSVDERLPSEGQAVLYAFNGCTFLGTYLGNNNNERLPVFAGRAGWLTGDVKFWMPTPPPPGGTRLEDST
jgi:hypothetical protein